jgi:predicted ATPase
MILHPHLLPHLIDLFKFEHTNPHQAQLIFSCHTPEVFNILQKHQIYLCRKRIKSEAWRLDEVVGVGQMIIYMRSTWLVHLMLFQMCEVVDHG